MIQVSVSPHIAIRPLTEADVPFADELRQLAGWNQTMADWERFIRVRPGGCFLASWDGVPSGTVTTITYGQELAWIGMMLVHPDYRRRGISTVLMQRALDMLTGEGIRCIKLDATPLGEPVYRKLGFVPEWELQRWVRATDGEESALVKLEKCLLLSQEIWLLDVEAFGVDRSLWVKKLATVSNVASTDSGFGLLRQGMVADYLGPVIARDTTSAERIIRDLLSRSVRQVYWDIPCPNSSAERLAASLGFQPVRRLIRMWIGDELVRGNPLLQYGIGDPATG